MSLAVPSLSCGGKRTRRARRVRLRGVAVTDELPAARLALELARPHWLISVAGMSCSLRCQVRGGVHRERVAALQILDPVSCCRSGGAESQHQRRQDCSQGIAPLSSSRPSRRSSQSSASACGHCKPGGVRAGHWALPGARPARTAMRSPPVAQHLAQQSSQSGRALQVHIAQPLSPCRSCGRAWAPRAWTR